MIYGYACFSTEQDYVTQIDDLIHAGATIIFKDKITDTSANRPEFDKLMNTVQKGDTLIVTKLERLTRYIPEALSIVKKINAKGVILRILNIGTIDNSSSGQLIFKVFNAIAELKNDLPVNKHQERKTPVKVNDQAKPKNTNYHGGMPRKYNKDQIDYAWKLHTQNHMSYSKISKKLGISKATIYRRFRELRDSNI